MHDEGKHTFLTVGSHQLICFNACKSLVPPMGFPAVLTVVLKYHTQRCVQGKSVDTTEIDQAAVCSQSENP